MNCVLGKSSQMVRFLVFDGMPKKQTDNNLLRKKKENPDWSQE